MRSLLTRNETLVALIILAFCAMTAAVDPRFLSVTTLTDLIRNGIVIGMFAIGVMLVLVSGGIDVSFTAVAAFSMYSATKLMVAWGVGDQMLVAFLVSALLGLTLGLVNAVFIGWLGLPTLIVTLGTLTAFRGFLLTFVGSQLITNVPPGMRAFSRSMLFRGTTADGAFFALPTAVLFLVGAVLVTWFILNRTMLGRSIVAMGGSREAAARVGVNVRAIQFFVYGYVGVLSGLAGIVHASLARVANPFDLVGLELSVIAAVVLGGARLTGGHGTITGTLLGVALIVLINNSLIMLGIPSTWQNVVIGFLILLGTGVPAWQARRRAAAAA
ncbi:ABC transporter permease [Arenibaculum pallidiluteum]|uniref:ABC transporter permease n=1 Tax=Arenibaculum pallidiluteum TaxID=2812559 RepID=UPI001A969167|nr:ABC transporter permease [Arenibaculum pallidiluteum]